MSERSDEFWSLWQKRLKRFFDAIKKAAPFGAGILAAFLGIMLYTAIYPNAKPVSQRDITGMIHNAMASATPRPAFSVAVYQAIRPSLVTIQSKGQTTTDGKSEYGLGSGVVVDDSGDILTALHVVANSDDIQVFFADGSQSGGKVVIQQPENDIAVLRPANPPATLAPATLGNPGAMREGDEAYTVGNPFGLYNSMSAGIISGFGRSFQPTKNDIKLNGLIQIDTAVNPGNSGGPLLNRYGEVIGIIEGIENPTGQDVYVGIAFAVPINIAGGALGSPLY